jgi:hypothetical protein
MASLRDLEIHSEKSTIFIQKQRKSAIHRCYLSRTCAHGAVGLSRYKQSTIEPCKPCRSPQGNGDKDHTSIPDIILSIH